MNTGHYSVIGYVPDPARQETLNIGAIVWSQSGYKLQIDEEAVARVVRENPKLERDALLYVESMLESKLDATVTNPEKDIPGVIGSQSGFPLAFSEPRFTALPDREALDASLAFLIDRVVRPRRRHGGPVTNAGEILKRELRPLLRQNVVEPNHVFTSTRTGRSRRVDFFANHGSHVAIDSVRLAVQRADEIGVRADAEAFKVFDIRGVNESINYLVMCEFAPDEELAPTNALARRVIEWAGGKVCDGPEEVMKRLTRLLR